MKNHYSDPTANTAIGNVERERRRAARQIPPPPRKKGISLAPRRKPAPALTYRYVRFDESGHALSSALITLPGDTPGAFLLLQRFA